MADINIDFEKMYRASAYLSSRAYMFSNIRRAVGLSRWKLPEDIRKQKNIGERMEEIMKQLQTAEQLMNEMKTVTNSCISQYMKAESKNAGNADKFL